MYPEDGGIKFLRNIGLYHTTLLSEHQMSPVLGLLAAEVCSVLNTCLLLKCVLNTSLLLKCGLNTCLLLKCVPNTSLLLKCVLNACC
jgi:hypothetical protein